MLCFKKCGNQEAKEHRNSYSFPHSLYPAHFDSHSLLAKAEADIEAKKVKDINEIIYDK